MASNILDNLIAYWPFDEGSGPAYNRINGRPANSPNPTWETFGGYLSARDWGYPVGYDTELNWTSGPWAVAVWFRLTALPGASEKPLILRRTEYGLLPFFTEEGWKLSIWPNGSTYSRKLVWGIDADQFAQLATPSSFTSIGDYFVVVDSDGSTEKSIYLNGSLAVTAGTGRIVPQGADAGLLNDTSGSSQVPVYGAAIWNRRLTTAEITTMYGRGPKDMLDLPMGSYIL